MIKKLTGKIAEFEAELTHQKELLKKSEKMNFEPVGLNGELVHVTGCGERISLDDHIEWLQDCEKWTKTVERKKYESDKDKIAARKRLKERKEKWRPKYDYQCEFLQLDELGNSYPPEAIDDFCEKFQTGVDRKYISSVYPQPCEECATMRNPAGIRSRIDFCEKGITRNQKYIENLRNSSYEEDENAENHCVGCVWLDNYLNAFDLPFCGKLHTPVNSETGSCGKFWVGLIPKNECYA